MPSAIRLRGTNQLRQQVDHLLVISSDVRLLKQTKPARNGHNLPVLSSDKHSINAHHLPLSSAFMELLPMATIWAIGQHQVSEGEPYDLILTLQAGEYG